MKFIIIALAVISTILISIDLFGMVDNKIFAIIGYIGIFLMMLLLILKDNRSKQNL